MKKRLALMRKIILFLVLATLLFLNACMRMRPSDKAATKYFSKQAIDVEIHHKEFKRKSIRYVESNINVPADAPLLVFVHGAPGAYNAFNRYMVDSVLLTKARLLSIDRLGYGYSDYGEAEPSIEKQAAQVQFVVQQYPESAQVILVGHSYGGPVVAKCIIDFPAQIHSAVMLAPVNDPEHEKIFWFSYFAKWKLTSWLLPKSFRVAGTEKFAHAEALQTIAEDWSSIQRPIVHIHGAKNPFAPAANIEFSKQHIPADYLRLIVLPKGNHFIPWNEYEVVKQELLRLLAAQ